MASKSDILLPEFKTDPYWWDAAPRRHEATNTLPAATEVAIIGSGYTGLSAALTLARNGRQVTIIEQDSVGFGASSRNFGLLGRQFKFDFTTLIERHGLERAKALYEACDKAFVFVNDLIERERLACFHTPSGRFIACNTRAHYNALEAELAARAEHLGHTYYMVPKASQGDELGTETFVGGGVIPEHNAVHPGLFHNELADRVGAAGAVILSGTRVSATHRRGDSWDVETNRGTIVARHLVAATNGYTGKATPWLRRRIIPIRAYVAATEPLPESTLKAILPTKRCFHDSARNMRYARTSPDGTRLIFGALTGEAHDDPRRVASLLHEQMIRLFPQVRNARFSHVWTGQCGGTFDFFPHIGQRGAMHYAMGYCFGAGMPFGTWLGHQVAQGILGQASSTPLDALKMPSNPFYWGKPWFLPLYLSYQRWLDWTDGVRD